MTNNELLTLIGELSEESVEKLREYAEFLRWREQQGQSKQNWTYNFIEHFTGAERGAERDSAGLEIKVADATCAGCGCALASASATVLNCPPIATWLFA